MTQQIYQLIKCINLEDANFSIIPIQEIVNCELCDIVLELYHISKTIPTITQLSYRLECDDDKEQPILWNQGMPTSIDLQKRTILYLRVR
jgi:hypothetical protein